MRIAHLSILLGDTPPSGYGGIERTVSYITEELVRRGHDVTLFATGSSRTQGRLVPICPEPIPQDMLALTMYYTLMLEQVFRRADEFDIIHNHMHYYVAPFARRHSIPVITTMHEQMHVDDAPFWKEYHELPLVAVSESQRRTLFPELNWQGVIHWGFPADLYPFRERPEGYLVFLGRLAPHKGLHNAIAIAQQAGVPLKIAGAPEPFFEDYFEEQKRLHFDHPLVEYIGELQEVDKADFLGGAAALLFPIEWDEPFGLVMVEAMACGTPVIAYPRGAVPEIIDDGVNGFLVSSVEEAVAALSRLPELSRRRCRETFEARFTLGRMVDSYEAIYRQMIDRKAV